jgi:hypothetical protein
MNRRGFSFFWLAPTVLTIPISYVIAPTRLVTPRPPPAMAWATGADNPSREFQIPSGTMPGGTTVFMIRSPDEA